MKKEIVNVLSGYLGTAPYQTQAWDQKVIDYFIHHPEIFHQFRHACDLGKWDIYHSIRYGR